MNAPEHHKRNRRLGIILCLLFGGFVYHRNDGDCYRQQSAPAR